MPRESLITLPWPGRPWQQADEDRWPEDALDYAGKPCRGVRGPLFRDKPRTRAPGHTARRYRLTEYLGTKRAWMDKASGFTDRSSCPDAVAICP